MNTEDLLEAYRRMVRLRDFEERVAVLYRDGDIPGFVHLSIGQEASAVGATFWLTSSDIITSTHRGHGHTLAKGLDARSMFAELMGKSTGTCGGLGGSMHIADPTLGIFGANGIVAGGLPIAVGAATSIAMCRAPNVVIAFFGDGAVSQGAFHESVNLAALWSLPIVFFCENNGYSEFSRTEDQSPVDLGCRAAGYGVDFMKLDGNDVAEVADAMAVALERIRREPAPIVVESVTLRVRGHYEGDQQRYRTEGDVDRTAALDPLRRTATELEERGIGSELLSSIRREVEAEMSEAIELARVDPEPAAEGLPEYVYAVSRMPNAWGADGAGRAPDKYSRAVKQALDDALGADENVFLAGIDVAGGNVFGLTRGLADKYPGRVLDVPISETALMGLAVGSAMAGRRPVVELMYLDFLGVCLDQLMNQAAKLRFMTAGRAAIPMVVRTQFGSGRSSGSQHSQSLEAILAHIPGLKVVMPYSAHDTYHLLREAIDDENPVVFIENRLLYERSDDTNLPTSQLGIGHGNVLRKGSDATIVSWSRAVETALAASAELGRQGIEAEVVDLRSIVPWDRELVLESIAKTGRLCVVHDAVTDFGVGAEIAAVVSRDGFWDLDAPVARVGAGYSPAPYAPVLERAWMPDVADVVSVVRRQVELSPGDTLT